MRLYADAAAYTAAGYGTPPANIDLLLRQASRTVDSLLIGKVYDVDTAGMPTDPDDVQALSDAACAIAAELDATKALKAGQTTTYDAVAIGNVNLSGRKTATGALLVDGVPVPTAALTALADVGRTVVSTARGGYVRPLDRIV